MIAAMTKSMTDDGDSRLQICFMFEMQKEPGLRLHNKEK